jgi:flagellar hook-basal body complex protein FliE
MIKNYGQMQNTLKNYDMKNWSKSVEVGNRIDFKNQPFNPEVGQSSETKTFGDFLVDSVAKVNNLQADANTAMEKLASGKSNNLHETLLAVEKADIAFKTMNQVRSKVIDAYREIMKMQI